MGGGNVFTGVCLSVCPHLGGYPGLWSQVTFLGVPQSLVPGPFQDVPQSLIPGPFWVGVPQPGLGYPPGKDWATSHGWEWGTSWLGLGYPPAGTGVPPNRTSHGQDMLWSVHFLHFHKGGFSCSQRGVLLALTSRSSFILWIIHYITLSKQESPPAGNCKKCTAYGITCPSITYPGGYPIQSWPGGYPIQSWPGGYPIQSWQGVPHPVLAGGIYLMLGYPSQKGPQTSQWGIPQEGSGTSGIIMGWRWGTPPWKGHGTSGSIMGWRW